jgi:tripartite-type tricarboxylate transporter receptor subunit TctC
MTIKKAIAFVSAAVGLACVLASVSWSAQAQTWPQRTVKIIVPLGPGSGSDIGARMYAERLSKKWGQNVIVENRPGADGVVAANALSERATITR